MSVDASLQRQITGAFSAADGAHPDGTFPGIGSLSASLDSIAPAGAASPAEAPAPAATAALFATAAVEIWERGLRSFVVAVALTDSSPVWSSVAGYYSSHYSVRGIAHLLGHFQMFRAKKFVDLRLRGGTGWYCSFAKKDRAGREHVYYWKKVKEHPLFKSDPLFTNNDPVDRSDVAHRDRANYADHVNEIWRRYVLDSQELADRVNRISSVALTTDPVPSASRYPDLAAVQLVAYHRLLRFRRLLDDLLAGGSSFWAAHRVPRWSSGLLDLQVVDDPALVRAPA